MDPNETLKLFYESLLEGRWEDTKEHYLNLKEWLDKGGFEPKWNRAQKLLFENFNPNTGLVVL